VLRVKVFYWLNGPKGLPIVAIGLVSIMFSLLDFAIDDFVILLTGDLPKLSLRVMWYLLLGAVASLFSALCVAVWRPILPRIVIALFSVSMASHVLERLGHVPIPSLRIVAVGRLLVALGVVLVYLRYQSNDGESITD